MALKFTAPQRINLGKLGLGRKQIEELEATLPYASASLNAKVASMQDVRDTLVETKRAIEAAIKATEKILDPRTVAAREASNRVMMADFYSHPERNGKSPLLALQNMDEVKKIIVIAIESLKGKQRHATSDPLILREIDRALLDGFIKDAGIGIPGLPTKQYQQIEPSRTGAYSKIFRLYLDVIGQKDTNPDRAIRNHMSRMNKSKDRPK